MALGAQLLREAAPRSGRDHPPNPSFSQERLGSGGDISHGKYYFLENLGYSGQLKAFNTVAPDTLSWLSQKVISNTRKATSEDRNASSPCFPGDSFSCFASKNQPFVYCFSLFPHGKPFIYFPALPVAFNLSR